ncbi:hypothetical protein K9N68_12075 [Kovacikia minuta CCNUW1]|uniref:hypothetical protein n=1 Tax=Kovacikia minuta TaxID=2931930 RepID=UPI001CCDF1F1|nr:hypothetical protein [Kovacikia minuta]UBF28542.1 hypothetical protein K9N68_12075 [Kovacikia minuta CCNUW1]
MNADHTNQLFEDFPALYWGRHLPVTENLMSFGFCCGDGWFELLYSLSQQIQNYNLQHPEIPVIAIQVKEKFGGLRFYVDQSVLEIEAAIAEAELKSLQICEITGRPGRLHRRNGYYQTVCSEKARELGFEPV